MDDIANPLMPPAYDLVWSTISIAAIVMLIIALVSLSRNRAELTAQQASLWVLLMIFLPLIGPFAWLLAGRPARLETVAE